MESAIFGRIIMPFTVPPAIVQQNPSPQAIELAQAKLEIARLKIEIAGLQSELKQKRREDSPGKGH
jgi:hypothetical protein